MVKRCAAKKLAFRRQNKKDKTAYHKVSNFRKEKKMALTNEEIIEALKEKTLVELAELRDLICETFGVTATAAVAVAGAGDGGAAAAEEKTEFDVVLEGFGDNKIPVIKIVRELTGLGLKEAKEMVEGTPKAILEAQPKDKAEEAKAKLEEAGAAVSLK